MRFHVGQKVVCITDDFWHPLAHLVPHLPRKGGLYHVRGYAPLIGDPCVMPGASFIWLAEIVNPGSSGQEPSFAAYCFRPVIERKTDISVFTKLLSPIPVKERAGA